MSKKIFIIEDDANLLFSLQAKFSLEGFQISTSSGNIRIEEIMGDIKKFKPDMIVLDLILPRIDGFDLLKEIKADNEMSNLLVFIFTNLSDQDSRSRGLELGANYYFLKNDFSLDDFVVKVKKIIANKDKIGE